MSWYDEILASEEKTRERLAWLQSIVACGHHTPHHETRPNSMGIYCHVCKCGAMCFMCDDPSRQSMWQHGSGKIRETEEEIEELTHHLAEKFGGAYAI